MTAEDTEQSIKAILHMLDDQQKMTGTLIEVFERFTQQVNRLEKIAELNNEQIGQNSRDLAVLTARKSRAVGRPA